jgi:hypothetical protein
MLHQVMDEEKEIKIYYEAFFLPLWLSLGRECMRRGFFFPFRSSWRWSCWCSSLLFGYATGKAVFVLHQHQAASVPCYHIDMAFNKLDKR